jgi:hypothetical protein
MSDRLERRGADAVHLIDQEDEPLLKMLGCLARIRMFDEAWQQRIGAKKGDRIVNIDVDCVITGVLDPLFNLGHEFTIMQHFNSTNPCPFNGSLWMFRAGERHDVWDDFSLAAFKERGVPIHAIPDDQGWLHHKFPDAKAYTPKEGVYCYHKRTWPGGLELPAGARVVAFPGRKPEMLKDIDWVKENWRC